MSKEELILCPYNTNNILIKENDIIQLLELYGIVINKINKLEILQQAFVHKSYCKKNYQHLNLNKNNECMDLFDESYERLEYLGDKVIKLIISTYLFYRYPKSDEGFMTKLQIKLEEKNNLSYISRELNLERYFIISKQTELLGGRQLDKLHEDILEAFIGALYISNGYEICLMFVSHLLETLIDYSGKLYCDNNYKDQLIKIYSQNNRGTPIYKVLSEEDNHAKKNYIVGVLDFDNNKYIGYGQGSSKKIGEQKAAKMALIKLGQLNKDQYSEDDIYYPK